MTEEQNIYLSKTLKDLENLLVYYKSNMRQTEKTISLIEEAIEVKNKNDYKSRKNRECYS